MISDYKMHNVIIYSCSKELYKLLLSYLIYINILIKNVSSIVRFKDKTNEDNKKNR